MTIFCPNGHENPDSNRFCQECGSQLIVPATNNSIAGIILGDRYRIKSEIGQGGFGRTYLCEDINRFNELCVLKEFAPQVQGTVLLNKAQELFEREAGVMYRLQHPQIPMFREMFRVHRGGAGQLFLVQDYVDGVNYQQLLRHKLQQGSKFSETEITEFLTQILPVLGYIHALGVIHRDISPDNLIKRHSDGLPVLIDFGGVKQVAANAATEYMSGGAGNADVPTRLGKVGYAPNEQMQRGVVFPHSDLYALAATTLVLLTGKEPPDLIDPQNFTWNWREHISLKPNLGLILDRMLQLRPNDRFQSAEDALAALQSGNYSNSSLGQMNTHSRPTEPPKQVATAQVQTIVTTPAPKQFTQPVTPSPPGLLTSLGKTWILIPAVISAIGLGWVVANLRPKPTETIEAQANLPDPNPSESTSPKSTEESVSERRSPAPSGGNTPILSLQPTLPTTLMNQGVNAQAYGDAIKQIFLSQNPRLKVVKTGDRQIQSQVDKIASELGNKLTERLSSEAVQKIGKYTLADRSSWKSQVNKLHLSERALIDLTDAKYRTITPFSAQKFKLPFEPFLKTAMGQIYLATMFDRVQAIQTQQAMAEIVFPIGGTSGNVSGTLQPGEGTAYIASLDRGQDIAININANQQTQLSIYPPTSKLPALLSTSKTQQWSGKTTISGYHEFVLVSQSDQPIQYDLKLTAADLPPTQSKQPALPTPTPTPNNDPDAKPLW